MAHYDDAIREPRGSGPAEGHGIGTWLTPAGSVHVKECLQASSFHPSYSKVENAEPEAEVPVQAGFWKRVLAPIKGIGASIRRHPHIAVLPLMALGLMIGLGVWGVMAASQDSSNTKKSDATASATEVVSAIEVGPQNTVPSFIRGGSLCFHAWPPHAWPHPRWRGHVASLLP